MENVQILGKGLAALMEELVDLYKVPQDKQVGRGASGERILFVSKLNSTSSIVSPRLLQRAAGDHQLRMKADIDDFVILLIIKILIVQMFAFLQLTFN